MEYFKISYSYLLFILQLSAVSLFMITSEIVNYFIFIYRHSPTYTVSIYEVSDIHDFRKENNKIMLFFFKSEWNFSLRNESTVVAEEYCRAIIQTVGWSCCC